MKQFVYIVTVLFILAGAAAAQNRFEGYSVVVNATNEGTCPVWYLPGANNGNAIDVFIAGTGQKMPATGLTACDGASLSRTNGVFVNPNGGEWCFSGPEPFYEVRFRSGASYLWYPVSKDVGFYNVKDFRPVVRKEGATPEYTFIDPPDYTSTIRNAIAYIAVRQGGVLRFPDGDYVVGTLDGDRRDPAYEAITLPSGITVEGTSMNSSVPTTNVPLKMGSTRIRLRNPNQSIFRIGGCTNNVAVRNMELLGNSALYGEARRDQTGDYGIEGLGKWILGKNGLNQPNSTQVVKVEDVTFQNLDRGIFVHNANDTKCNSAEQSCDAWQFEFAFINRCNFLNNRTGIWINTWNTDWNISNAYFSYTAANAPGDGIRLQRAGLVLIQQSYGGGYDYGSLIGGTFLYIDAITSVSVISCETERSQRSIYTNPLGATTSTMLNVIGCAFGDKVDLNGRLNFTSSGNAYGPKTIDAEPGVNITSMGDHYCYDSMVLPGRCVDESGRNVPNPGPISGRRMFETGRVGEDTGPNRIEGRPNYFGYNVEIGDGLLQFDRNITLKDITAWAAGAGTRPRAEDGAIAYCKDCRRDNSGACAQGTAGRDGAFAKRINGQWRCD